MALKDDVSRIDSDIVGIRKSIKQLRIAAVAAIVIGIIALFS